MLEENGVVLWANVSILLQVWANFYCWLGWCIIGAWVGQWVVWVSHLDLVLGLIKDFGSHFGSGNGFYGLFRLQTLVTEQGAMGKLKMGLNYLGLGLGLVKFQLGQVFGLKGIFLGWVWQFGFEIHLDQGLGFCIYAGLGFGLEMKLSPIPEPISLFFFFPPQTYLLFSFHLPPLSLCLYLLSLSVVMNQRHKRWASVLLV